VHYHIIIFGKRWLKSQNVISQWWQEYYQGIQVKLNSVLFDTQCGFMWEERAAPEDSNGRQPMEYLKKYLLKGQYFSDSGSMYWLNAFRFYTYSQTLLSDEHKPRKVISKGLYEFAGIVDGDFWMYNGDTFIHIEPVGPSPGTAVAG
jgi:hypothetical protein